MVGGVGASLLPKDSRSPAFAFSNAPSRRRLFLADAQKESLRGSFGARSSSASFGALPSRLSVGTAASEGGFDRSCSRSSAWKALHSAVSLAGRKDFEGISRGESRGKGKGCSDPFLSPNGERPYHFFLLRFRDESLEKLYRERCLHLHPYSPSGASLIFVLALGACMLIFQKVLIVVSAPSYIRVSFLIGGSILTFLWAFHGGIMFLRTTLRVSRRLIAYATLFLVVLTVTLTLSWATLYITDQMWQYRHAFSKLPAKISLEASVQDAAEAASQVSKTAFPSLASLTSTSVSVSSPPSSPLPVPSSSSFSFPLFMPPSVSSATSPIASVPNDSSASLQPKASNSAPSTETAANSPSLNGSSASNASDSAPLPTTKANSQRRRRTSILFNFKTMHPSSGRGVSASLSSPETPSSPSHSISSASSSSSAPLHSSSMQRASTAASAKSQRRSRLSAFTSTETTEVQRGTAPSTPSAVALGALRGTTKTETAPSSFVTEVTSTDAEGGNFGSKNVKTDIAREASGVEGGSDDANPDDSLDSVLTKAEEIMQITSLLMLLILTLTVPTAYALCKFTPVCLAHTWPLYIAFPLLNIVPAVVCNVSLNDDLSPQATYIELLVSFMIWGCSFTSKYMYEVTERSAFHAREFAARLQPLEKKESSDRFCQASNAVERLQELAKRTLQLVQESRLAVKDSTYTREAIFDEMEKTVAELAATLSAPGDLYSARLAHSLLDTAAGKRWVNAILYLHSHATEGPASDPSKTNSQGGASGGSNASEEPKEQGTLPVGGECVSSSILARHWKLEDASLHFQIGGEDCVTRPGVGSDTPCLATGLHSEDMTAIVISCPTTEVLATSQKTRHKALTRGWTFHRKSKLQLQLSPRRVRSNDWGHSRSRRSLRRHLKRLASSASGMGAELPHSKVFSSDSPSTCVIPPSVCRPRNFAFRNSTTELASFASSDKLPRATNSVCVSSRKRHAGPQCETQTPATPSSFMRDLSATEGRQHRRRYPEGESPSQENNSACSGADLSSDADTPSSLFVPRPVSSGASLLGVGVVWEFDVLDLAERTPCVLLDVGWTLLHPSVALLGCHDSEMISLLHQLETRYLDSNPYHTATHAAHVAHAAACLNSELGMHLMSSKEATMSLILSALAHDVGHLGKTNAFLQQSRHPLATIYNDQSILENFHCSLFFRITSEISSASIFAHVSSELRRNGPEFCTVQREEDAQAMRRLLIKASDLSHALLGWKQHFIWSCKITEEFYRQGDREIELQLPVSPLCNRSSHTSLPQNQVAFLKIIVDPMLSELEALEEFLETLGEICSRRFCRDILRNHFQENLQRWSSLDGSKVFIVMDEDTLNYGVYKRPHK